MKKILLFLIVNFNLISLHADTIIFDLEGVLIEPRNTFWHIGPTNFFCLFNPLTLQQEYFKLLEQLTPRDPQAIQAYHNHKPLPQIMNNWLAGTISGNDIQKAIDLELKNNGKTLYSGKKKLLKSIARYMFSPEHFARSFKRIKSGKKLVKYFAQHTEHKLYILSNFDAETFNLLAQRKGMKKLFDLFDGIIISGNVGHIKPDPAIFEHLFKTYAIDPHQEQTIYIDDEYYNVASAQQLGKSKLICLHCRDKNFHDIEKQLKQLKII